MQVSDAFYASLPAGKGLFWVMFVIATAAAIVASQALISATFAIVSQVSSCPCCCAGSKSLRCMRRHRTMLIDHSATQAITQSFFPHFRVVHTSKTHSGQIYVPVVNNMCAHILLLCTVICCM